MAGTTTRFIGVLLFFLLAGRGKAQVFWTEDFNNSCSGGCLASSYVGTNGAWTITNGTNGTVSNQWFVSCKESGQSVGACGLGCPGNATLHVGSNIVPLIVDPGAAYYAGPNSNTNRRIETPAINCSGRSNITLNFKYIEFGDGINDDASLYYFDGSTWTLLNNLPKTLCCGGVTCTGFIQGIWTNYSISLPASANNNPNVKIGFLWVNNADNIGTDPSFAVDDITLSALSSTTIETILFENPGNNINSEYSWICPCGVTSVDIELWGGGGGGGGDGEINADGGAGGGSGAYRKIVSQPVTPGRTYNISVAYGGNGGGGISSGQGAQGSFSNFTGGPENYSWRAGGGCGGPGNSSISVGSGACSGVGVGSCTASGAQCNPSGSFSLAGYPGSANGNPGLAGASGGGAGGSAPSGGAGGAGRTTDGNGSAGTAPGGGGGGAYHISGVSNSGGKGGAGMVRLTYTAPNPAKEFPVLDPIAIPDEICEGESTTLSAQAVAITGNISSYSWSSGLTGNVPGGVVSPVTSTVYVVTVTTDEGCSATDSVSVIVKDLPDISVTPSTITICQNGSTTLTATGASTYTWAPASGLSATTGATVTANPTVTTTYTVTGTLNGCTGTTTVTVWVVPTPTLSPDPPCAGQSTTFTAGSGSLYDFTVDGVSQGSPSATNTFTSGVLTAGTEVCVRSYPAPPYTFDGNINEPQWGNALATSSGGPGSGFGALNNLDALFLDNGGGYLYGAIAGQTENNSNNRILMFIDCAPGGYNNLGGWTVRTNAPYVSVENLNGLITFDPGFAPEYILCMNQASGIAYFDLYNMATNTNNYLGSDISSTLLGYLPNGSQFNNTLGFEFAVPLSLLGNPSGAIQAFCMLVNDPGLGNSVATFLSNQFLTRANVGENNYGNGFVDFGAAAPNPISYSLQADCYSQKCVTAQSPATPIFSFIDSYCEGELLPPGVLPAVSDNGISGSWSPPSIDTSVSGSVNHTFTPSANQCANPVTKSINIKPTPTTTNIFHD
jgi:hypothetical protein